MKSKFLNALLYIFATAFILLFVLKSAGTQPWVPIVCNICSVIIFLIAAIYLIIMIYCIIENKKIDKLLDNNKYDELIAYCEKRINKKNFFLPDRKQYYKYLRLLSYLGNNDLDNIEKGFADFDRMNDFPITYYWKSSYLVSVGRLEEVEDCYNHFMAAPSIRRKAIQLENIFHLIDVFHKYSLGNINDAKEALEKVDESKISIPCSLKAIEIIKNAISEDVVNEDTTPMIKEDAIDIVDEENIDNNDN